MAAAGFLAPGAAAAAGAGVCANAVAADSSAMAGRVVITRRIRALLLCSSELLQLLLRLGVVRVELDGLLEILDRRVLLVLALVRLRHRLIGARRLRIELEVEVEPGERAVRLVAAHLG